MKKMLAFSKNLVLCFLLIVVANSVLAQTGQWTWISGDSTQNQFGVYGAKGTAAAANNPGGREGAVSWSDASGNLWLFGGIGYSISGLGNGLLNDLWKYNIASGLWTWVSGDIINEGYGVYSYGLYGTKGTASAANKPGGRNSAVSWSDGSGNLWLFGGEGWGAFGFAGGLLNDLWKYNIASGRWTWVSGDSISSSNLGLYGGGVYGTKGIAAAANMPKARRLAQSWFDASGNLWLFGGEVWNGYGANDLWKYNIASGLWTWVSGDSTYNELGVYGTKGIAAAANKPETMEAGITWSDGSGNLWLFCRTFWKYNITSGLWTWVNGDFSYLPTIPVYGTKGIPGAGNFPGSRHAAVSWSDASGNLWLFGGNNYNDLWKYNIASGQWTWVSGDESAQQLGLYGTKGIADSANKPGNRQLAVSWTDASDNLWLFGGLGYPGDFDYNSHYLGLLNDLWKFSSCTQPSITWYRDADGDGYGTTSQTIAACTAPQGYVANSTDCDDSKPAVHPGAVDACNNADDNCNGQVDEGCNTSDNFIKVNLYAGTNPYTVGGWNNWNVAANNVGITSSNYNYSDGRASTINTTISGSHGVPDNGATYADTMCPQEVLRYTSYSASNRTLTLRGLNNALTYDLEFYASRSNIGNSTQFIVGGLTKEVVTDHNRSNKVVFTDLVPVNGQIVISMKIIGTFCYLNGFILAEKMVGSGGNSPQPSFTTKLIKVNLYGGVNPYNEGGWNNWNVSANNVGITSANYNYSDGTVSSINGTLTGSHGVPDNGATYGGTMCPPEVLRYASYSASNRTLTFKGINNAANYDVEFYSGRATTGNTTIFTMAGVTKSVVTDNNRSNKVVFTDLVPVNGQLVVTLTMTGSFNYLNGFILTEKTAAAGPLPLASRIEANPKERVKLENHFTLTAYPNPTTGYFDLAISGNDTGPVSLRIVDIYGRLLFLQKNVIVNTTLRVGQGWNSGTYLVEATQGNHKEVVKLMKLN
jgi:hypothetical protein